MSSQTVNHKRFFIHTLGCKVNQYESQVMREMLLKAGYRECLSKDIADIYILNTCTVTHHADRESRHWIGLFHRTNPKAKIIVTGCYVENDSDHISFMPGIYMILKNAEKVRIAEFLDDTKPAAKDAQGLLTGTAGDVPSTITGFEGHTKAFVKIQDGCENRCSYCKVPFVRSSIKSKPVKFITEEVRTLVENGYREIVLVGICLGAWGTDMIPDEVAKSVGLQGAALVDALKAVDNIKGDFRIRLSSIEPRYVTDELIDFMAKTRRMCRHLHIPLQSGDDEILKMMNRPYTTADYKSLIEKARSRISGVAITTDMLVGFPGETDERFRNTVNFVKEIIPARTHIFRFSKREGTAAHGMPDVVSDDAAKQRYMVLRTATLIASYLYRSGFLGEKLDVLVESKREKNSGLLTGYTDNYIRVLFKGPDELMKKIVPVKITDMTLMQTLGEYDGS
ncbi:MAG: tRNA (N(6)-L-threonylcarbamoyladenosine(37)-C(2))-methylthiotransferase MtaB [Candidatus Omnitrophica bacterium]|nr:tRNA (N(6)-L-threonylcarbamoyladenosine(37)-C(2))-methylthiotransferase MtaB [Candidatus Omnitrophota bacterium]